MSKNITDSPLGPALFIKNTLRKKREPKWLSWKVIFKIGSLLWGRATFFLHNHVYKNESSTPEKRAVFQNGSPGEPFSKKRLETVLFLKKESCYSSPRELLRLSWRAVSPDKKRLKTVLTWKREPFSKWLPFLQKRTILALLGSLIGIWCYFREESRFFLR